MTLLNKVISLLVLLAVVPMPAISQVQVFACEPEWASLAKEIGGDEVSAYAATNARQDPHHIRAKPSLIAAMRKADLAVCSGAGLEVGWLPILLEKAGNAHVQPGAPGFLLAADYVLLLDKPTKLDRAEGDIHPEGNPHLHLNPHNVALVAKELADRLQTIDAANRAQYQARFASFAQRWNEAIQRWEQEGITLKDAPVVVHHKSFTYLLEWLGMQEVGSLEPKPGIPPTTSHLESLLQELKDQPAQMILRTPYDAKDASQWLAVKTGTQAVVLPFTIGGDAQSADLFALFDRTLALLKEAQRDQR
jgi:zinc/manganese transport system substrate-binding protein